MPGFLGFDRLGGYSYFADHIAATLRGAFELKTGVSSPVVPLGSLPANSLLDRQRELFAQLRFWTAYYKVERIKLVGHSTGGVDAYFALCNRQLDGTPWSAEDDALRRQISHVVTLGAPFLGTTLADAPVARAFGLGRVAWSALRDLGELGRGAVLTALDEPAWGERIASIASSPGSNLKFLLQLTRHRELVNELSPEKLSARHAQLERDHDARLVCYASYVFPPRADQSSALFQTLYRQTSQAVGNGSDATLLGHCRLLEQADVVGFTGGASLTLDAHSNDGVVNTLRQLPPHSKQAEVGAVVVADHADLLGYFDRFDPRTGIETQRSIFRSGARFRDEQFFGLFARVIRDLIS